MNVLITGGTGFIGSRLALKCLENGEKVRIYGQENTPAEKENRRLIEESGGEVVLGSMTDLVNINKIVQGIDVVFHLAAAQHEANVPDQVFWDVNVTGTKNILDACVNARIKRFVHGSTIGVYGNKDEEITEETICVPENIYGITKLEGENLVLSYRDKLPLVVIRISETYGPGDRRLLKLFKAIGKKKFLLIGSGQNLHQLIYVDDLLEGLLRASERREALGEVILLVGKQPITTKEMVHTIADVLQVRLPKISVPIFPLMILAWLMEMILRPLGIQPPLHRRRMDFFKKSFHFASKRAFAMLDFVPKIDFRQGAEKTAHWYRCSGLLSGKGTLGDDLLVLVDSNGADMKPLIDTELAAQIEPFDTFWEAPQNLEKGYASFGKFYKRNYFQFMPVDKKTRTLVVSCGPGYLVKLMQAEGYTDVKGIDSDPVKVSFAVKHGLNCQLANAFSFLRNNDQPFDLIFAEQEINHLTKEEIVVFLKLCKQNLTDGGTLFIHTLNGANPLTGSEALAQNFNHFNTMTEYSLKQVLQHTGFVNTKVFPLNLYIFYENPFNYVGMVLNSILNLLFRLGFIFYGKENKLFSKKIAAVSRNYFKQLYE